MSTKIYDGTRYPMSIGAERYGRMFIEKVKPIHERLVAEATGYLLHTSVWSKLSGKPIQLDFGLDDKLDGDTKHMLELRKNSDIENLADFLVAAEKVVETASKSSQRCDPRLSLECSVSFVADSEGSEWGYAYPFASNTALRKIWPSLPGVEEYGYWNNTDGPREISEEDWDERGDVWERVLGWESWAECGVRCEPPIPSPFLLYVTRQRWFTAVVTKAFIESEANRRLGHESRRTQQSRELLADITNLSIDEIAAQQEREDRELEARFR